MDEEKKFRDQKKENIAALGADKIAKKLGIDFMLETGKNKYTYNFTWLGRPIIQYPQDMIVLQEIIWDVKPDLIIETGIAHGGSLIFSASILELVGNNGQVLGIDIDIRDHNRREIEAHPLAKRITMIQGSSIAQETVVKVRDFAKDKKKIMVILDSNHTHEHVLEELKAYSSLVSVDSYLIVFDTAVEDFPADYDWGNRPWGKGNNPKTAVWEFLKSHNEFQIDEEMHKKLIITVAPDGFLRRVK